MRRSRLDAQGQPFIPDEDLASLVDYLLLFPDAECDARLATALLAAGEPLANDCGSGQGSPYDTVAGGLNYYNYSIVDTFHLAALQFALVQRHDAMAEQLLGGYLTRLERYQDPNGGEPGQDDDRWERDVALLLLKGAALGLPLTSAEARQVHRFHQQAVDSYQAFPHWDLWDDAVPNGTYDFRAGFHPAHTPAAIRIEDIAFVLEYCWSPFRNPAGARFADCDIVSDPARWGEG